MLQGKQMNRVRYVMKKGVNEGSRHSSANTSFLSSNIFEDFWKKKVSVESSLRKAELFEKMNKGLDGDVD